MVWGAKAIEGRVRSSQFDADTTAAAWTAVAVAAVRSNLADACNRASCYIDCSARRTCKVIQVITESVRLNIAVDRKRASDSEDDEATARIALLIIVALPGGTPVDRIKD